MCKKLAIVFFILFGIAALLFYLKPSSSKHTLPSTVYAVYDSGKVGETAMVSAVIDAIKSAHPTIAIIIKPNTKIQDLKLDDSVIITAGQFGIELIGSSTIPENTKVLLCVHQWFDGMKDLHDIFVTMPEHAIDEKIHRITQQQHITLIPTQGVLHTLSVQTLKAQDTSVIHLTDAKVGLILGGDAEMPNGKDWLLFSIDDARKLAREVADLIKKTGYQILVTNGPRTGAFISPTTRDSSAHKGGELDRVSSVFLDELYHAGLQKGQHFEFFDFQFGQPSVLKAVMAVILKNKGFMIVPGESTSSISEIMSVMPAVIYENDAMNSIHKLFIGQATQNSSVTLWPDLPDEKREYIPLKPQAFEVIKKLFQ